MFDYQTSKHAHFDAACRAFAIEHNLEDVAAAVGMRSQVLRNKLNPAQPHRLTCDELLAITDYTEDAVFLLVERKRSSAPLLRRIGLARLYVSLCPNMRLIFANHEDQLLFFSIEPEENWRGSGRTYLKGLAVTDTPASVGTTRLRFSSRRKKLSKQGYYSCVISRDGKIKQEIRMKNWQKLFGIKPKFEDETPPDDTAQGDDKLQALANAVNELEGRVAKIENQLNDVQGDVDTIAEVVDTEEFAAIRDNAKDIVKRFNDLGNKSTRTPGRKISEKAGKFNFL